METQILKMFGALILGVIIGIKTDSEVKAGLATIALYWLSI